MRRKSYLVSFFYPITNRHTREWKNYDPQFDREKGNIPKLMHLSKVTQRLNKKHIPIFLLTIGNIVIFTLHYLAMVKSVGTYDTAKFQYTGYTLGVPHTSGYPLYTLISWVFTHTIAIGEVAWRQNILNLLFSMGALNFLYFTFRELKVNTIVAFFLVCIQSFSLTFWFNSFQAEVYSLHLFFISIVTFLLTKIKGSKNLNILLILLCVYGLMFSHHLTSLYLFPGLFAFILIVNWKFILQYKVYLFSILGILLGLLPYLYIWIRHDAPQDIYVEMYVYDISSFISEITGGKFKGNLFSINWGKLLIAQIPMTIKFFKSGEIGFLILIGLIAFKNKERLGLNIFFILSILFNIYFVISFDVYDPWGYYAPIYFFAICMVGVGSNEILNYVGTKNKKYQQICLIILVLLFVARGAFIYKNNSKRIATFIEKEETYRKKAYQYLNTLNSDSIFIISDDQTWQTMHYLMQIEKKWPPIVLIPLLDRGAQAEHIISYLNGNKLFEENFRYYVEPGKTIYINDEYWIEWFKNNGFMSKTYKDGFSILLPKKP